MAGKILNTRVDPDVMEHAENILNTLGISRSVAINMFYRMVILRKGLPWQPNLDETEYIKQNPKLFEQIKKSEEEFRNNHFLIPSREIADEIHSIQ